LPSAHQVGRLHVSGPAFYTADNQPTFINEASFFKGLARFAAGQDLGPALTQIIGDGATTLRVLGMYAGALGQFRPTASYPATLDAFLALTDRYGLRVDFVVFADAQNALPALADQQAHLARVAAVLVRHPLVHASLCNECEKNGVDPSRFARPAGATLWSRGSGLADAAPPLPVWDWIEDHPGRPADWPRRVHCGGPDGFTALYGKPCVETEPMGASEVNQPGKRDTDSTHFFEAAAAAKLLTAGWAFHSDAGLQAQPLGPVQQVCALAAFAALNQIPNWAVLAPYTRGGLTGPMAPQIQHSDSLASRTYAKALGSSAWDIAVLPQAGWKAVPIAPWRIVRQLGSHGELVELAK
jgi:hypothetical protein